MLWHIKCRRIDPGHDLGVLLFFLTVYLWRLTKSVGLSPHPSFAVNVYTYVPTRQRYDVLAIRPMKVVRLSDAPLIRSIVHSLYLLISNYFKQDRQRESTRHFKLNMIIRERGIFEKTESVRPPQPTSHYAIINHMQSCTHASSHIYIMMSSKTTRRTRRS